MSCQYGGGSLKSTGHDMQKWWDHSENEPSHLQCIHHNFELELCSKWLPALVFNVFIPPEVKHVCRYLKGSIIHCNLNVQDISLHPLPLLFIKRHDPRTSTNIIKTTPISEGIYRHQIQEIIFLQSPWSHHYTSMDPMDPTDPNTPMSLTMEEIGKEHRFLNKQRMRYFQWIRR